MTEKLIDAKVVLLENAQQHRREVEDRVDRNALARRQTRQMPASTVPPPNSFTRQQVEAMLRVALTDRTDEWTIKSVDERVAALLAMFTKEKP